jgi:hypothetical protein
MVGSLDVLVGLAQRRSRQAGGGNQTGRTHLRLYSGPVPLPQP